MKKHHKLQAKFKRAAGALTMSAILALCLDVRQPAHADAALDEYLKVAQNDYLSAEDKKALKELLDLEKSQSQRGGGAQTFKSGEVVFTYGVSRPNIVCAVLELTDIALEPGEVISAVQLGDTARWIVDAAISGTGEEAVQHLIVKPLDSGLKTSLIITTDRRVYHLSLKSTQQNFMPSVRFVYPGLAKAKLEALIAKKRDYERENTIPGTAVTVDKLSFAYKLSGDESLKPLRVFNDGAHTYIEMPDKLPQGRMPALVIIHDSGFFSEDKISIANYRIQGRRFVVDSLFERAKLILGDGDETLEVIIEHQGA